MIKKRLKINTFCKCIWLIGTGMHTEASKARSVGRTDDFLLVDVIGVKWDISDQTWTFLDKAAAQSQTTKTFRPTRTHTDPQEHINSDSNSWWGWGADVSPSQRPFNEDRQYCLQLSRGRKRKRGGGDQAARDLWPFQLIVSPSEGVADRWWINELNLSHTWVNLIFPSKPWASRVHLTSEVG